MLGVAASLLGCSAIPIKLHTETHIQHADGRVEHESSDWEGSLDELPAQIAKSGQKLGAVTSALAKELTDVPPPGKIELKDIDPGLAKYQGKRGVDFVAFAHEPDGKPIDFEYVRLGVPAYDDFFKKSQEIHALVHQATQTVGQLRHVSSKLHGGAVDAKANLKAEVDRAMGHMDVDQEAGVRLRELVDVGSSLGRLLPRMASSIGGLIGAGERLVVSAPSSLTNPKVVMHLDLVKKGLLSSVDVVRSSSGALLEFGKDLSPFG